MTLPLRFFVAGLFGVVFSWLSTWSSAGADEAPAVYEQGSRRELFVDRRQTAAISGGARLQLHSPVPANVALAFDSPWDGDYSAFVTVLRDGDEVRMYYRGWKPGPLGKDGSKRTSLERQVTCLAVSKDGVTFTKPKLGLYEFQGSKENNIVVDHPSHNFAPFIDTRPGIAADERYKALQTYGSINGKGKGLSSFASVDGIHWRLTSDEPVITKGAFDSQNIAFWDSVTNQYRSYYRVTAGSEYDDKKLQTAGIRTVAMATSPDFATWSDPQTIDFGNTKAEHLYTNATTPYFRAPHYYFMFPKRLMGKRSGLEGHNGISDGVFLSSRDGLRFDREFLQAFIRPGRDPLNWGDRSIMTAYGLVQTGPDEMSVYYSENYRYPSNRMRRGVLRLDGIASLHAEGEPGELVTKPLRFTGKRLELNYATSAAGTVQVEIQDEAGKPIPGFTLKDAPELFGDKIDGPFAWKNGTDVSSLAGKTVRLRFVVRDADVYAYRFAE
ncbi:MAG: hypothetical protein C0483_05415 [Pirellula sp.]|nr:hypothetical protein [Pirellula sp.]